MTPGYAVMFVLLGALCALIGFAVAARLYGRLVDDAQSSARQAMAIARRAYDKRGTWQSTPPTTIINGQFETLYSRETVDAAREEGRQEAHREWTSVLKRHADHCAALRTPEARAVALDVYALIGRVRWDKEDGHG